jgi:hypothetical protein
MTRRIGYRRLKTQGFGVASCEDVIELKPGWRVWLWSYMSRSHGPEPSQKGQRAKESLLVIGDRGFTRIDICHNRKYETPNPDNSFLWGNCSRLMQRP